MTNDVPGLRTCSAVFAAILLICCAGSAGSIASPASGEKQPHSFQWRPFEPVVRPPIPRVNPKYAANPVDAFLAAERQARGLKPRPEAAKEVLLRRVYLDLIGLSPMPEELLAFESDKSPKAYEKVVDRLLADPRYGERWGRHWMDVWRYSDWAGWSGGNQIRDSKPHIWRWRDWIIESLNHDQGYDRMLLEMLAADELVPEDTNALRATGFLVRNYKMLSREQWLEDTVKHTSQAFLGLTMGCAKCHDHKYDPISQMEYYEMRAIFEPYQVRTDRIPGQLDTTKDGLVRIYDTDTNGPTYLFVRGDERRPDTNRVAKPGIPKTLGGSLRIDPVKLPHFAAFPDKREFVLRDTIAASEAALADARRALLKLQTNSSPNEDKLTEQELALAAAEAKHSALLAVLGVERLGDDGKKETGEWRTAATEANAAQRKVALAEAKLSLHTARFAQAEAQRKADEAAAKAEAANDKLLQVANPGKESSKSRNKTQLSKELEAAKEKTAQAEKAVAEAEKNLESSATTSYKPRPAEQFPATSTGRRLAFARWLSGQNNPLTARVAMNQIWLRHFGRGIVASMSDFGHNGTVPSHPQLLDWLAAEFMAQGWRMKPMHRLLVTSRAYRMAATPDAGDARIDPDNIFLWRMNSRRMEAELVRDNLLYIAGDLDPAMGGPDIDNALGLTSHRRSIYLRTAAEKEVEFLKIFDGASVTECYARRPTVVPQQALALANSELTRKEAQALALKLARELDDEAPRSADFSPLQRPSSQRASATPENGRRFSLSHPGSPRPSDSLLRIGWGEGGRRPDEVSVGEGSGVRAVLDSLLRIGWGEGGRRPDEVSAGEGSGVRAVLGEGRGEGRGEGLGERRDAPATTTLPLLHRMEERDGERRHSLSPVHAKVRAPTDFAEGRDAPATTTLPLLHRMEERDGERRHSLSPVHAKVPAPTDFAERAFVRILARDPSPSELKLCREFLDNQSQHFSMERARENLVAVLFNHSDFVTIR